MQKRVAACFLSALTTIVASVSSFGAACAQVSADGLAVPLQAVERAGEPYSMDHEARPALSAVSTLQAEPEDGYGPASGRDILLVSYKDTEWQDHPRHSKVHAVSISLKNTLPVPLEIMQGQVVNGLDELQVSSEKAPVQELKHQAMNFLMRGSGMVSGFGVISANNYGASTAMSPVPAMNFANSTANSPKTGAVTGQFVNEIINVTVNPSESYTFKALVPNGTNPEMKMTLKNLKTGQVVRF